MPNENLILAVSADGKEIDVKHCREFLKTKDKEKLANFIYDRLYGRYIRPFDYTSDDYIKNYKNGFAIMTSCCLLIETYVSFTDKQFRNTDKQSGKTFGHFFTTEWRFSELATGGRKADGSLANRNDGGLPNDFFEHVRCGILHNAETRNNWIITRKRTAKYFDPTNKTINATKFANRLKAVLNDYKKRLMNADFDKDDIWVNFKNRLKDLIDKS
ncbi:MULTISPECIES: hypothetical protein [Sphingobacterium]|uniref:hypothetical protein n=1 Tax=Sphingobacterium TaxID=28453 RepID=UPI000E9113C4|nr:MULTISPECIES: hypothetical protein [Sphingobacterium]QQT60309.1 hypothetical protein I6I97_13775 [Sphingobacterium multivorum]HBI86348.1 hypothetical protein [Sphingobacterium sp.]